MSDLSPELVLVLPPEQRELALASLPTLVPNAFLDFRGISLPPSPVAKERRGTPLAVAALAYAARAALGMLMIGLVVSAAIVVLVVAVQLVG